MSAIFIDSNGKEITKEDIVEALKNIGVDDCKYLFLHSDISFGRIAPGVKKKQLLDEVYGAIIEAIGDTKLIVPTFSYSFCNNEDYDANTTKTSMGALNEYIRKLPNRFRTNDPLLSVSVPIELKELFNRNFDNSLGVNSALDVIHELKDIKFLFFGIRMGYCFTYLHYIEKMLDVPYRYDQPFDGNIITPEGVYKKTQSIHTACYGVKPADFYYFEDELEEKGILKKVPLGDQSVACITEADAYREIKDKIEGNINYFLYQPFSAEDLEYKYTKGLDGVRITHC